MKKLNKKYLVAGLVIIALLATGLVFTNVSKQAGNRSSAWIPVFCIDVDVDGYGNPGDPTCLNGPATDCDDTNASVNPGATEIVGDGIDQDCDGHDGCYQDSDGDGVGSDTIIPDTDDDGCADDTESLNNPDCDDTDINNWISCATCMDNDTDTFYVNCDAYVTISGPDCDDTDSSVYPGAPEICDNIDNNCDGVLGSSETDFDGDGFMVCEGDCDDADPLINPATVWYADADGDGYGDLAVTLTQCVQPAGYVLDNTDCNDADSNNWISCATCADSDGDTFYANCDAYVTISGSDCDDTSATVNPGATEICGNSIDDNCDGQTDEGCGGANPSMSPVLQQFFDSPSPDASPSYQAASEGGSGSFPVSDVSVQGDPTEEKIVVEFMVDHGGMAGKISYVEGKIRITKGTASIDAIRILKGQNITEVTWYVDRTDPENPFLRFKAYVERDVENIEEPILASFTVIITSENTNLPQQEILNSMGREAHAAEEKMLVNFTIDSVTFESGEKVPMEMKGQAEIMALSPIHGAAPDSIRAEKWIPGLMIFLIVVAAASYTLHALKGAKKYTKK